jgi:hypothetical protein
MIRATLWESNRLAILTRSEMQADRRMGVLDGLTTAPLEPTPIIGVTTRAHWTATAQQQQFLDLLRSHGAALTEAEAQASSAAARVVRRWSVPPDPVARARARSR